MYDMYHWDRPVPATEDSGETSPARARTGGRARARRGTPQPRAAQAVQVALDRRDNGGDSRHSRDQ